MYCGNPCAREYRRNHIERYKNDGSYVSSDKKNFLRRLRSKNRLNRRELSLDFLVELWEKQGGLCAITGLPMTHIGGQGRLDSNGSIDRIDSNYGYELDNVQLVTFGANRMKGVSSMNELYSLCEKILRNRAKQPKRNGKQD